jgi:hypothetical protein
MCPTADGALANFQQTIADLRRQLAESTAEREALQHELVKGVARQTATAEILRVVNSSPGDPSRRVMKASSARQSRPAVSRGGAKTTTGGARNREVAICAHPHLGAVRHDGAQSGRGVWGRCRRD